MKIIIHLTLALFISLLISTNINVQEEGVLSSATILSTDILSNSMEMKISETGDMSIIANKASGEVFLTSLDKNGSQISEFNSTYKGEAISKIELMRNGSYVCLLQGKNTAQIDNKSSLVYYDKSGNVNWEMNIGEVKNRAC